LRASPTATADPAYSCGTASRIAAIVSDAKLTTMADALVAWTSDPLVARGQTIATRQAIPDAMRQLGTDVLVDDQPAPASLHGADAAATADPTGT
jgi:hypothetical protein